jgi:hypothetical protein
MASDAMTGDVLSTQVAVAAGVRVSGRACSGTAWTGVLLGVLYMYLTMSNDLLTNVTPYHGKNRHICML